MSYSTDPDTSPSSSPTSNPIATCMNALKTYLDDNDEIKPNVPAILQTSHIEKLIADGNSILNTSDDLPESAAIYNLCDSNLDSYTSIIHSPINSIPPPPMILDFLPTKSDSSTTSSEFNIKKIGPYTLIRKLGSGSTGKVMLGIHEKTGKKIAIKIILRDKIVGRLKKTDNNVILVKEARLLREITLLSLLHHPHIVRLFGYFNDNNYYILFLEYIEGGPLVNYITQYGRSKEKVARNFFRQLLSAVSYCHRNGIVHRDLKVENILIDKNGNLKLIDFGLSNFFHSSVLSDNLDNKDMGLLNTFCGSLYYAAPELLYGRPYIGPEVDIWSLGIILYVITTGKVPFDDKNLPILHDKIKNGKVYYPPFLSKSLITLLKKMIVTDSSKRATMQNLFSDFWVMHANTSSENPIPLPKINIYIPTRYPISFIDKDIIHGVAQALGGKYSYRVIYKALELALNTWDEHKNSPIVMLYYLVKEKFQRWNAYELSRPYASPSLNDIGLSNFGRKLIKSKKDGVFYLDYASLDEAPSHMHKHRPPKHTWLSNAMTNAFTKLLKPFESIGLSYRNKK